MKEKIKSNGNLPESHFDKDEGVYKYFFNKNGNGILWKYKKGETENGEITWKKEPGEKIIKLDKTTEKP